MEYIKIAKVDDVVIHKKGVSANGTLHLTTHHLIFTSGSLTREFWFAYPTIGAVYKNRGSTLISKYKNHSDCKDPLYEEKDMWQFWNIKIVGKDYTVFSLDFEDEHLAQDVYDSLLNLTVLHEVTQLYAFIYTSNRAEQQFNSWNIYEPLKEFQRQGLDLNDKDCRWRISTVNQDYNFCKTYPKLLVVPSTISDTLLTHSMKFRSQNRIPALTYFHRKTCTSITRCAQPLPGIIQQRSIQDEKLISEIFNCSSTSNRQRSRAVKNIIVDARPTTNAMAQTALGGGTENMDNYSFGGTASRMFLGIDNIHVMRDVLNNVVDHFLVDNDLNLPIDTHALNEGKSGQWLKYVKMLLSSTDTLAKSMLFNESNIMIHCSDGWDRTTQVCSLVQICLDPYFRTIEGFMILIEKDWLSFGHRFSQRSGHLSSESSFHDNSTRMSLSGAASNMTQGMDLNSSIFGFSNNTNNLNGKSEAPSGELLDLNTAPQSHSTEIVNRVSRRLTVKKSSKFTSPVFQQFLDCVYQLHRQNPSKFEFNERFLRRLVYHLYSCQYGTFLFDSEYERAGHEAQHKTRSVWDYFRSRTAEFTNNEYNAVPLDDDDDWILPDLKDISWWWQLFGKRNEEMNTTTTTSSRSCSAEEQKKSGLKFPSLNLDIFGRR